MSLLRRWLKRGESVEDRLRADRPEPPERLLRSIASEIREQKGASRTRLPVRGPARVAALSGAVMVGLLAVGGLGYAMNAATDVVVKLTSSKVVARQDVVKTVVVNAANAQYGTTTTTSGGGGGGGTTTTTTTSTTTTSSSGGGETSAVAQPGTSGSIQTTQPGSTQAVIVKWDPSTFTGTAVDVNVDPTPPITGTTLLGAANHVVSITITDPNTGQEIHSLSAPLEVLIQNPPPGFVPGISTDGVNFRALTQIAGPPLPAGMQDGYYQDADGVHILTRHVTLFAVLYKANITVSETGRKTAAPGSGKFGDPTRIHVGAPALRFTQQPTVSGKDVRFTFYVDEQAAVYFHVTSGGQTQRIVVSKSAIRAHRLSGINRKTLHIAILRPGTIVVRLRVNGASPDSVSVTAVDFDGHKVSASAKAS